MLARLDGNKGGVEVDTEAAGAGWALLLLLRNDNDKVGGTGDQVIFMIHRQCYACLRDFVLVSSSGTISRVIWAKVSASWAPGS